MTSGARSEDIGRGGAHRRDLGRCRWIVGREPIGEARRPDLEAGRPRSVHGVDDAELRAAAADVDDERLVGDRHALGHADDREVRLLLVREDVERRTGRLGRVTDDRACIGRATDRFGPEERDVGRAERTGGLGVAREVRREVRPGRAAKESTVDDGRSEPEERRFIGQRLQMMADQLGDEEVDRIRAEVDRRADDPARG